MTHQKKLAPNPLGEASEKNVRQSVQGKRSLINLELHQKRAPNGKASRKRGSKALVQKKQSLGHGEKALWSTDVFALTPSLGWGISGTKATAWVGDTRYRTSESAVPTRKELFLE